MFYVAFFTCSCIIDLTSFSRVSCFSIRSFISCFRLTESSSVVSTNGLYLSFLTYLRSRFSKLSTSYLFALMHRFSSYRLITSVNRSTSSCISREICSIAAAGGTIFSYSSLKSLLRAYYLQLSFSSSKLTLDDFVATCCFSFVMCSVWFFKSDLAANICSSKVSSLSPT